MVNIHSCIFLPQREAQMELLAKKQLYDESANDY
jgi:hypothetical protein